MSYVAIGVTGLVGSHFVAQALESKAVSQLVTISRREPGLKDNKVKEIIADSSDWPEKIKDLDIPEHSTFFSAFGTTRKIAGSAENFVAIDHGINYASFKAAKESGKFDTAIIVSSIGSNKNSRFLYLKTKGQLESDIIDLKFKRTIILQPGALLGREGSKGFLNNLAASVGSWTRGTFIGNAIGHPVYGHEVAKCALIASQQPITKEGEVIVITSDKIIEMAKQTLA
ncbi:hypothetical protein CANINC_003895 [Pichia inconspicua]|uniref:NAD(P)-binding domain-containing protein n=1 Tax=Pichia inconspicua TaxID=52247 RepID=A0A4T0WYY7_9ASCO|nr:hypothetical protein CANINC_003895 [[Candida] inconspicua]